MIPPWRPGRAYLIAEAGVNHNGDMERARALIDLAADAGADAVKFQTFRAEALATSNVGKADYQARNLGDSGSQLEMLRALELPHEAHGMLRDRALERGIFFFSTAFDHGSIDFLEAFGQQLWKIPSGEITNYPYLVRIAKLRRPTILSTGMATLAEVGDAVEILGANGLDRELLCVLHCNTEYPTPWEDVNLRAMPAMGAALGCAYGYSDHTPGIAVSVAAAALGAQLIEKHFTLHKDLPGPDHKASLSPDELREWVAAVRAVELALGSSAKRPTRSEAKNRSVARKAVVAARPIAAGEAFSEENLTTKRTSGVCLSPMLWPRLLGRLAPRAFETDEGIEL